MSEQSQKGQQKRFALVAIEARGGAGERLYTYIVPESLVGRVAVGSAVLVPFGPSRATGYVVELTDEAPAVELKAIQALLADEELFDEAGVAMAKWMSENWLAPVADCLRLLAPPGGVRNISKYVEATASDPDLSRAPRRRAVWEALRQSGGRASVAALQAALRKLEWPEVTPQALRRVLRDMQEAGLVRISRKLRRPTARPLARKHVMVADMEAARQALDELRIRAPIQAMVLDELLAAHPRPVRLAGLRANAVKALEKRVWCVWRSCQLDASRSRRWSSQANFSLPGPLSRLP